MERSRGPPSEPLPTTLAWLIGHTVLFMALTAPAYRREQSLKFA